MVLGFLFTYYGNYLAIIPLALVASAALYLAKKKVKGVVEDERDNTLADRSARHALITFVFLELAAASLLLNFRQSNPDFYLVASVLLYAATFQMMLYGFIFFIFQHAGQRKYLIGAFIWLVLFLLVTVLQLTGHWASALPRELWR
jgi:uncharacterized membrane protein